MRLALDAQFISAESREFAAFVDRRGRQVEGGVTTTLNVCEPRTGKVYRIKGGSVDPATLVQGKTYRFECEAYGDVNLKVTGTPLPVAAPAVKAAS